jgi:hypothetical protein
VNLKRSETLALVIAGLTLLGSVAAPVATIATDRDPQPVESCVAIYDHYDAEIAKGSAQREAVLPGADGRSLIADDPDARYCHLTEADFPAGVTLPQPLPTKG